MATEWAERVRRTKPWRLVIRGAQAWFAGAVVIGAAVGLGALGLPKVVVIPLALAGFGIAMIGFPFAFVGMVMSLAQNFQRFSVHAYDLRVMRILWTDLLRVHPPAPFVEPSWPPPQWRPCGTPDLPVDTDGSSSSGSSASGS
jgi:hypothetical protein